MQISNMNWFQVEERARVDDRAVLPLGSTEQHAYLSLSVDSILAERVAVEAVADSGIPVFPTVPYGLAPYFRDYPGTVTLTPNTYNALVAEILDGIHASGFNRILIVNGHGGNSPVQGMLTEWASRRPGVRVRLHNWWNAPRTFAQVQATDKAASHASWMENFPWTRLKDVALPDGAKEMVDTDMLRQLSASEIRAQLGDGNYGGRYQRPDEEMQRIWETAISETRDLLENGWAK